MLVQKKVNNPVFKAIALSGLVLALAFSLSSFRTEEESVVEEECIEEAEMAVSRLTVEIQNYSDWNVRLRAVRSDGTKGPLTKIYKPGSHTVTLDNASKVIVQWQDGMNWKKYNAFTVRGSSMCVKATGKVMQLNGIKVVTGC